VPTNAKTAQAWLNFNAASSLTILAETMSIKSGSNIQISSRSDGSLGAVKITGVTGNILSSYVIGNGTNNEYSSKLKILSADAKSFTRHQLVKVENGVANEIMRPYRSIPSGDEITTSNTVGVNTFFRESNSIKYIRRDASSVRLIFYRFGQGSGQSEPLAAGDVITITPISNSIVEISLGTTARELAARVGDMMYIRPTNAAMSYTSPFPSLAQCVGLSATSGTSDPEAPEYWGYPVIKVVNAQKIQVIAPNITASSVTTLSTSTDLVFMPAIFNEKNAQTNKKAGAKFKDLYNSGEMYYIIKALGGNIMSLWVINSANEATDSMLLDNISVNTDDKIVIGKGFDSANQGEFKIIGTNGRNHVVFYNENGGKDEIVDSTTLVNGGRGQRNWKVGPIKDNNSRPIRIIDSESVRIGDRLRISSPAILTAPWFPASLYGSWRITGLGYIGISQASGTLTAKAAHPVTGIRNGDKFAVGDGSKVVTFEFTTTGVATGDNVPIIILATMPVLDVVTAILSAINGLGSSFSISAEATGTTINLTNRKVDGTVNFVTNNQQNSINYTIIETMAVETLNPFGMLGAIPGDGQICPYVDIEVPNAPAAVIDSDTGYPIDKFQISGNTTSIGFVEQIPFSGYRLAGGHSVNPQIPEESDIFLVPQILTSKMSETFGTKITGLFKLGFEQTAFQGIDGYKIYSGLVREAHRVIDGLPTNTILYPGVKAMGAPVEVLPPLVKTIRIAMQVRPKDGVTINSISEIIKSTVAGYVNGLSVGKPVVISEVIKIVQSLPGVFSVSVTGTTPAVTDDRIVVGDMERAMVHSADSDITVG
jgi:hypothetical protein